MVDALYPEAPYWWQFGVGAYYGSLQPGDPPRVGVARPGLAERARAYLEEGKSPRLSQLLADTPVKGGKPYALVWAWVYFLNTADGGAHREYARKFHQALLAGKSPGEALSATMMMEKAAAVFVAARDPVTLSDEDVAHLHGWADEHFRQGKIWGE